MAVMVGTVNDKTLITTIQVNLLHSRGETFMKILLCLP